MGDTSLLILFLFRIKIFFSPRSISYSMTLLQRKSVRLRSEQAASLVLCWNISCKQLFTRVAKFLVPGEIRFIRFQEQWEQLKVSAKNQSWENRVVLDYTQGHSKVGNLTRSPESVLDKLQYHQIKRGDINGKGKKKEAVEKFELKMIRGWGLKKEKEWGWGHSSVVSYLPFLCMNHPQQPPHPHPSFCNRRESKKDLVV